LNRELVKQRALRHLPRSHHRRTSKLSKRVNQRRTNGSTDFFNTISADQTFVSVRVNGGGADKRGVSCGCANVGK
ncbi:hypothetical protein, partial [Parasphingorhabdus sp.]